MLGCWDRLRENERCRGLRLATFPGLHVARFTAPQPFALCCRSAPLQPQAYCYANQCSANNARQNQQLASHRESSVTNIPETTASSLCRTRLTTSSEPRSAVSALCSVFSAIVPCGGMAAVLAPILPKLSVSTISRNDADYTRQRSGDILSHAHSTDPALHPFAQQREYTRALNAVKYEKLFAKPFLFALDGHRDAVYSLSRIQQVAHHCGQRRGGR